MDKLGAAWQAVEDRYGVESGAQDITARAVMGMALMLALDSHHAARFDRARSISLISEGTVNGFFPKLEPALLRR